MACVKNCCCCVNLRVGGIMMGVMTLALSVFSIIPMAVSLANRMYLARVMTHLVNEYSVPGSDDKTGLDSVTFWGSVDKALNREEGQDDNFLPQEDSPEVQWLAYAMLVFFIVSLVLLAVYAVCSVLLIYGAARGNRWLLLPWLVCTFSFILAYLGGMCLSLILVGVQVVSLFLFFVALVEVVIAIYLWVCVVSLHQVLGSEEWLHRQPMQEMKPRFSTKYASVPSSD